MTAGQRFFTIMGITLGITFLFGLSHLVHKIQLQEAMDDSATKEPIVYFLPSQGLIHSIPGETVPVMLFGAAEKASPIFGEQNQTITARIDNENLIVDESIIDAGIVYKDITPFSICLEVLAEEPGIQTITQVILMNEKGK